MDIAASVVAFIGLSGQILQGCNYLCGICSDAVDAPDVIIALSNELCAVISRLEAFKQLLLEVQASAPGCLRAQQDPTIPLQNCQKAIQKLQSFVDKYVDLSVFTTSNFGNLKSHKTAIRKAWQKFDVARRGDQLRELVLQLETAKSSLSAAQDSIQFALQLQHLNVTREVQRNLQQLQDEHTASAQIVKDSRNLVSDIHYLQKDNHLLAKMTNLSLDKVVSNNQRLLVQSTSSEQHALDAKITSEFTQRAVTSLGANLANDLLKMLAPKIQDTITQSLAIHNSLRVTEASSTNVKPGDMTFKPCTGSACTNNDRASSIRNRSGKALSWHESASSLVHDESATVPTYPVIQDANFLHSVQLSRRGPKRQKTSKSVFNAWFGRIELTSSTTEQDDDMDSDYPLPMRLQARRTSFRFIPNQWFLRVGVLFETGKGTPTISHPGWDNRLRIIRTHQHDSSVMNSISRADYVAFRKLLESREVSPFDLVKPKYPYGRLETLFETAVHHILITILTTSRKNHVMPKSLLQIAKLLADSGVDCGVGSTLVYVFQLLSHDPSEHNLSLFRVIMEQSQTDPLEELAKLLPNKYYSFWDFSILTKQEHWDVSEFTKHWEDVLGNGSFQFMLENESDWDDWVELQKQKWRRMPVSLRRSRSHCLAAFGENFVETEWVELYWLDERPAFWQSREACKEFFGDYFVTNSWPKLYWRQELPTFWRSREACLEAFGGHFVDYRWPELYWRQELPTFWRSREACLEAFGGYFVDYRWPELYWRQELPTFWHSRNACLEFWGVHFIEHTWPGLLGKTCFEFLEGKGTWERNGPLRSWRWWKGLDRDEWIGQMIESWSKTGTSERHTRQYCIDQYGVNFVKEELPSLLKQDGLPEGEVIRLTQDGPDMEPPAPHPYWKDKDNSGSDCEELKKGQDEHDADSNAGTGGESDDELSDGWQTADED